MELFCFLYFLGQFQWNFKKRILCNKLQIYYPIFERNFLTVQIKKLQKNSLIQNFKKKILTIQIYPIFKREIQRNFFYFFIFLTNSEISNLQLRISKEQQVSSQAVGPKYIKPLVNKVTHPHTILV